MHKPTSPGLPLTQAQLGIWLGQQMQGESTVYHTAECIELNGPLDRALFDQALYQTLLEADALHTRFVEIDGVPYQYPGSVLPRALQQYDFACTAAESHLKRAIDEQLERPFALEAGHVYDHALYCLSEERHVWLHRAHHLALDGYGFNLVARRVAEHYSALLSGAEAPPGVFAGIEAVVDEDRAYQRSPACERDRQFWLQQLADAPPPLMLGRRTDGGMARGTRISGQLDDEWFQRMRASAREARLDWPDVLLALVAGWLARQHRNEELVLGLPVMLRLGSKAVRVPCMAMNIVALRLASAGTDSLLQLAEKTADALRALKPHQRYRYEHLKQAAADGAALSRRLFGPVVNLMPFDTPLAFGPCRATVSNVSAGPVEDISFAFAVRGERLFFDLDGHPQRYAPETLARLHADWIAFARAALEDLTRPLLWPPVVAPVRVSAGEALAEKAEIVYRRIAGRARQTPDAVALIEGASAISYDALHRSAANVAVQLQEAGVGRGDIVAVHMPRSSEAIIALLAIHYAGAAYLAFDPAHPAARRRDLIRQAEATLVLSNSVELDFDLPEATRHCRMDAVRGRDRAFEPLTVEASDPAYLVYTSGSTGEPKGVRVSQGALAHFAAAAAQRYGIDETDRVLQFAPLTFDASVEEIFVTLAVGGTLVVRDEAMLDSMPAFLAACSRQRITLLDLPTAFWHELVYALHTQGLIVPACVRSVVVGGEAVLPERIAQWRQAVTGDVRLFNTYGPSEATVVACCADLSAWQPTADRPVPIGLPLPGVSAVVLDEDGLVIDQAETAGELYLLGPTLADGYHGRTDLSAERFVTVPALPSAPRAYRTGDRVHYAADGQLVFLGRVDDEFKISGHRIAPLEVESVLSGHPQLRMSAVFGQSIDDGRKRLVAYVVADAPAPAPVELRRFLQQRLPPAMVPSVFRVVDSLPRTTSGKIDRKRLAALESDVQDSAPGVTTEAGSPAPNAASGLTQTVLGVWAEILGQSELKAEDDFFALGGQSLQMIQVANRLSAHLQQPVAVATLFKYPSAAALAHALRTHDMATAPTQTIDQTMYADAHVPARWFGPTDSARGASMGTVLLTGATGFVGVHLLDRLLRQTRSTVICLVRAAGESDAYQRIHKALQRYGLNPPDTEERIVALAGDLTQADFGLAPLAFERLAGNLDLILHCAAQISVVRDYQSLKAANVGATREIVRLAAPRRIPLHYISTLAVVPPLSVRPTVPEDFVPAHAGLKDGYQQSKWLAEYCVQQAASLGLPVAVYRLGRVVGSRARPVVNEHDLVWRIIRASIRAAAAPAMELAEVWTPVDAVAQTVVDLVQSSAAATPGAVFNLAINGEVKVADVFKALEDRGYALQRCPMPEWLARVAQQADDVDRGTLAFFETHADADPKAMRFGPIEHEAILRRLPQADRTPVQLDLLHAYFEQAIASGLFPAPGRSASARREPGIDAARLNA